MTWALTGEGPEYVASRQNPQSDRATFIPIPRHAVEASAEQGAPVQDEEGSGHYAFTRKFLKRRGLTPKRLSVITAKGDSMEPDLHDGDLILLARADAEPADGKIHAVRFDSDLFVKRIQRPPGYGLMLISSNPGYQPITVDAAALGAIRIIGHVVNSTREGQAYFHRRRRAEADGSRSGRPARHLDHPNTTTPAIAGLTHGPTRKSALQPFQSIPVASAKTGAFSFPARAPGLQAGGHSP